MSKWTLRFVSPELLWSVMEKLCRTAPLLVTVIWTGVLAGMVPRLGLKKMSNSPISSVFAGGDEDWALAQIDPAANQPDRHCQHHRCCAGAEGVLRIAGAVSHDSVAMHHVLSPVVASA